MYLATAGNPAGISQHAALANGGSNSIINFAAASASMAAVNGMHGIGGHHHAASAASAATVAASINAGE